MSQAWYLPKALPSALKPRVPGDVDDESAPDDEVGILKSVDTVDGLVQREIDNGVEPGRIIVGGFSQGCAVSLVWGLVGKTRDNVGGVVCMSGYFPLAGRIAELRKDRSTDRRETQTDSRKKWLYVHGSKDMLVPTRLFAQGKEELAKWTKEGEVEDHLYEGMSHTTASVELRDMLFWLEKIIPP